MKILSFGAGMQSTALALMSCENATSGALRYPLVPVYDAVLFCDLGFEPPWVSRQVDFVRDACHDAGIFFKVLEAPLYRDFLQNFGERRTISIPSKTAAAASCGCPISYKAVEDLEKIRPYEPNVVKAAWNLFGASYRYRALYNQYKQERMEAEHGKK